MGGSLAPFLPLLLVFSFSIGVPSTLNDECSPDEECLLFRLNKVEEAISYELFSASQIGLQNNPSDYIRLAVLPHNTNEYTVTVEWNFAYRVDIKFGNHLKYELSNETPSLRDSVSGDVFPVEIDPRQGTVMRANFSSENYFRGDITILNVTNRKETDREAVIKRNFWFWIREVAYNCKPSLIVDACNDGESCQKLIATPFSVICSDASSQLQILSKNTPIEWVGCIDKKWIYGKIGSPETSTLLQPNDKFLCATAKRTTTKLPETETTSKPAKLPSEVCNTTKEKQECAKGCDVTLWAAIGGVNALLLVVLIVTIFLCMRARRKAAITSATTPSTTSSRKESDLGVTVDMARAQLRTWQWPEASRNDRTMTLRTCDDNTGATTPPTKSARTPTTSRKKAKTPKGQSSRQNKKFINVTESTRATARSEKEQTADGSNWA